MEGKVRVIHMAAVLGTADTITTFDVEKVCTVNIVGTTKILKAAKKAGVGRVLILIKLLKQQLKNYVNYSL
jgi:nucleoside-diphosphate-sugar epimerase